MDRPQREKSATLPTLLALLGGRSKVHTNSLGSMCQPQRGSEIARQNNGLLRGQNWWLAVARSYLPSLCVGSHPEGQGQQHRSGPARILFLRSTVVID